MPILARLNPLVKDIKRHPLKERTWIVTDTTRLFCFINYSFDYEVEATYVANGLDSVVRAPLGVVLRQPCSVLSAENCQFTLTEIVSIEAYAFVMYIVTSNLDFSHRYIP